jgi:NAD(P)-dependent dehydrogenase (short-subunit alcohol dehydrogenase family)
MQLELTEQQPRWWDRYWRLAKMWRTIRVGPVAAHFRLTRAPTSSRSRLPVIAATSPVRSTSGVAVIIGMGPGLGEGLMRALATRGMQVAAICRDASQWDHVIDEMRRKGHRTHVYTADVTSESSMRACVRAIELHVGIPDLAAYCVQSFIPGGVLDTSVAAFEDAWRANCLGAFIAARELGGRMAARGSGTIVLAGATSATIGRAGYLTLSVGKFGLRALAQVAARELGRRGVHVAHVLIDAHIDEGDGGGEGGPTADANDVANVMCAIHDQPRSTWTHELDLRPWNESFWEHC